MTTYWISHSLEELLKWAGSTSSTSEIEITVKCANDGDETTELAYRHEGLTQVARSFLLEQLTVEELSRLELEVEFKLSISFEDIRDPKIDLGLKLKANFPSSEPSRNPPPELTEETSRLKAVQEAEREAERKRRQALNPKDPGASQHRRGSDHQDRSGRGGHEFPRP